MKIVFFLLFALLMTSYAQKVDCDERIGAHCWFCSGISSVCTVCTGKYKAGFKCNSLSLDKTCLYSNYKKGWCTQCKNPGFVSSSTGKCTSPSPAVEIPHCIWYHHELKNRCKYCKRGFMPGKEGTSCDEDPNAINFPPSAKARGKGFHYLMEEGKVATLKCSDLDCE